MTTPTSEPVSLVGRRLPATVERTVHLITGEQPLPCPVEEWRDLLGVVERGVVELETSHGARLRLRTGDTFCLATVGAAVLRGLGPESAVVATVRRRKDRTSRSTRQHYRSVNDTTTRSRS